MEESTLVSESRLSIDAGATAVIEVDYDTGWDMEDEKWVYFESELITQLPSDRVYSIAVDENCVWFGTDEGLARYDKTENVWRV